MAWGHQGHQLVLGARGEELGGFGKRALMLEMDIEDGKGGPQEREKKLLEHALPEHTHPTETLLLMPQSGLG